MALRIAKATSGAGVVRLTEKSVLQIHEDNLGTPVYLTAPPIACGVRNLVPLTGHFSMVLGRVVATPNSIPCPAGIATLI